MLDITQEEEREELRVLLASGIFTKAPNVQSFLEFVAEKHFSGEAEEVKEYQIAIEALHRSEGFNPQSDTIVRVTAHSLRKRLAHYYSGEGIGHSVHIQLPVGRYLLRFVRRDSLAATEDADNPDVVPGEADDSLIPSFPSATRRTRLGWTVGTALALLIVVLAVLTYKTNRAPRAVHEESRSLHSAPETAATHPVPVNTSSIRFLVGENRQGYTDTSGQIWSADKFCKGGTSLPLTNHHIQGTEENALFSGGRKGAFHCLIPAENGTYEMHLFFADTEGNEEAVRQVAFTVNGGQPQTLDVVDLAGGDDVATGRVLTGIHPSADGTVHLDFDGEGSFVNAVELVPNSSNRMLPIRMHAGPVVVHDSAGKIWSPDNSFSGGRRAFHPQVLPGHPDSALFQWERYGHFHYSIPVIAKRQYTVTLYFTEAWFGAPNGAPGGAGSRVFNVFGDGTTLLTDFDILQQQENGIAKTTFHHVKPTPQGVIDLYFLPVSNYALVNAIEIEDES